MQTEKYLEIITNERKEKFSSFERMLIERNRICNLTSLVEHEEVIYKHFLDSVAGESLFKEGASVAEIGSGGGFPSIPLMIVRGDLKFTLIESTNKKCTFLKEVVDKLGLNCAQVLNIRAEDGAHSEKLREKFDCVCARAVAQLNTLCEYCLPYVKPGGSFIAYKGDAEEEIKNAENAIKVLGGKIDEIIKYELPKNMGARTLISIKKVNKTPSLYPRGNGKERKNPL